MTPTSPHQGGIAEEYRSFLPIPLDMPIVTLREGGTPLLRSRIISDIAHADVFLKVEGQNPTGSFKDRGMTLAVSHALFSGAQAVICASTGNTSASAAAYAARAGLNAVVVIPSGKIALGKLAQALAYGARVVAIDGNFDIALEIVRKLAEKENFELVNSLNPLRVEGQKTAAFEIVDALGRAPDIHCIPVGNGGNVTAYWKGYREYKEHGRSSRLPHMFGFQAAGCAPLVAGYPIKHPQTVATAIRIGNPALWKEAEAAIGESNGQMSAVTDEEILAAQALLANKEGVYCEPASATSVAGLLKAGVPKGSCVVCTLTGHGLKDPDTTISQMKAPKVLVADYTTVLNALGLS